MSNTITITIEPLEGGSIDATIDAPADMEKQDVLSAILSAAESYVHAAVRLEYEELFPGGNRAVIDGLSDQAARLAVLHAAMHVPAGSHLATTINDD